MAPPCLGCTRQRTERRLRLAACALALAFALTLFVVEPGAAQGEGIGVAPSTLRVDDPPLVRGGSMERTLTFQQHDHDSTDVEIRVLQPTDAGARDASSWITVDPSGTITVERTSEFPVSVLIDVPDDAANGEYRAKVEFRVLRACDSEGSCAAVQTAASSTLVLTVGGDQVKQLKVVGSPKVHHAELGGPLQFDLGFENTGNVIADPQVRFTVEDKHETGTLRAYWFNDTQLRPGQSDRPVFIVPAIDLPIDQYWGVVTVFMDGQEIDRSSKQTFNVLAAGALARTAELRTIRIDGDLTQAQVGDLVRLEPVVRNTGEAPIVAQFRGEVFVDGTLRDEVRSDTIQIPVGQEETLSVLYRIQHAGQHEFKGKVHYGGQVGADGSIPGAALTSERTLLLAVEDGAGGSLLWWIGGGLALLGTSGTVAAVVSGRTKRRRTAPAGRRGSPRSGAQRRAKPRPPAGRPAERRPPTAGRPGAARRPASGPPRPGAPRGRPQAGPKRGPPGPRPAQRPRGGPPAGPERRGVKRPPPR